MGIWPTSKIETLEKIPGIGKAIAQIKELAETGSLKFYDELRTVPAGILELFALPGLGPENQGAHEQLQVSSIAQLQAACDGSGRESPWFRKRRG